MQFIDTVARRPTRHFKEYSYFILNSSSFFEGLAAEHKDVCSWLPLSSSTPETQWLLKGPRGAGSVQDGRGAGKAQESRTRRRK